MDFKLTEEQQMLQDTAARLVRDAYPFEQREKFSESELGFSAEFWSQLGELGLTAVPFSEEIGGFGGSGVETMLVMTELGRGLTLEPYLQSVILAGGLINQLGSDAQKQDLLPQVAAGSLQLAVAFDEPQSHYNLNDVQTRAEAVDGGYRLSGRKAVVIGGHSAGQIIVSARTSGDSRDETGISLFLVDPNTQGVSRRVYPTIDGRKGCDLFLDNVQVGAEALLGELGNALPSMRYQQGRAIAAQCADALGSMDEACKLTLDYLKTRKQFGVTIGSFQVLQHRMVDMFIAHQEALSLMQHLSLSLSEGEAGLSRLASGAKSKIGYAGKFVADQAVQLHGGMGMTEELAIGHYFKRLTTLQYEYGSTDFHVARYARLART